MQRLFLILVLIFTLSIQGVLAQPSEKKFTAEDYVLKFKEEAIQEMLKHGIPASVILAQGMLESANGNSPLAVYANNHFGIKCHVGWEGSTFTHDDDEKNECFRRYENPFESFEDHSLFLKSRPRYAFLFILPKNDYRSWAKGLKEAGYATNPEYGDLLIDLIERFELNQYDKLDYMPTIKVDINASALAQPKMELRQIHHFNHTQFVSSKAGDTYTKIAAEFNLNAEHILKYNDAVQDEELKEGQKVYLQPKRSKASETYHVVSQGETMQAIAQYYGVKLHALYKRNKMKEGQEPLPGEIVCLSGKKTDKPEEVLSRK